MKKKKLKAIIKELERDIVLMDNEHIKQHAELNSIIESYKQQNKLLIRELKNFNVYAVTSSNDKTVAF